MVVGAVFALGRGSFAEGGCGRFSHVRCQSRRRHRGPLTAPQISCNVAFQKATSKLQIRSSSLKLVILPGPYLADMTAKCLTMEVLGSVRVERKDFLSIL